MEMTTFFLLSALAQIVLVGIYLLSARALWIEFSRLKEQVALLETMQDHAVEYTVLRHIFGRGDISTVRETLVSTNPKGRLLEIQQQIEIKFGSDSPEMALLEYIYRILYVDEGME